ncbi:CGNR zinc finger domain-containing protein [Streptomyces cellulosae]
MLCVKQRGRQEWCGPSCGNRARAARHYRRQRPSQDGRGRRPSGRRAARP